MTVFDVVNNITGKKGKRWEELEEDYAAFIINKALSFDQRTVLFANEMNRYHQLDHKHQYIFLDSAIPKLYKTGRWIKTSKLDSVPKIAKYYNVSYNEARDMAALLSAEELNTIMNLPE